MQAQSTAASVRWEGSKEQEVQHKNTQYFISNSCTAVLINWYYFPYRHKNAGQKKPDPLHQHNRREVTSDMTTAYTINNKHLLGTKKQKNTLKISTPTQSTR